MTENISKLATALVKAQAEFPPVPKKGHNPFLKSEYVTLDDMISAVREPLSRHGLAFVQLLGNDESGATILRTILVHESGEALECQIRVGTMEKMQNALQALGGAITYMRRYTLGAMLGLASGEDTDAEGTVKIVSKGAAPSPRPQPEPPVPASQPAAQPPQAMPNGNGNHLGAEPPARRPTDLLTIVNGHLQVPYENIHHLQGGIRAELGPTWSWPAFKDAANWLAAYAAAIKHGRTKEIPAAVPIDEPSPSTTDELAEWFEGR